jgi:hypothetical protein
MRCRTRPTKRNGALRIRVIALMGRAYAGLRRGPSRRPVSGRRWRASADWGGSRGLDTVAAVI